MKKAPIILILTNHRLDYNDARENHHGGMNYFMLAGTDDHLTWLSPVILNLESTGLTHLESEIRVVTKD